ncbi:unnamed protein product [Danaus chrysippus]|uniref:(African queen) hypothetical protein n=1 Tax=Danaus chrysippus TaxID=151541 RepID=A0A8J2QLD4_9NEOP|nr:unnamed protein product [Danaus chrysippus]
MMRNISGVSGLFYKYVISTSPVGDFGRARACGARLGGSSSARTAAAGRRTYARETNERPALPRTRPKQKDYISYRNITSP